MMQRRLSTIKISRTSTTITSLAIQSNFDYAKNNVTDFASNVAGAGIAGAAGRKSAQLYNRLTKGVFRAPSKNGALGTLKQYSKNPIGGGAEAVVVDKYSNYCW